MEFTCLWCGKTESTVFDRHSHDECYIEMTKPQTALNLRARVRQLEAALMPAVLDNLPTHLGNREAL